MIWRAAPSKEGAEFRAFWVDEFHAGIRTPQEAAQLVEDARRANVNTLIVQVRGRADALYTHSLEPPREDPAQQDIASQFVDMISHQRAFQANSKSITTADEMLQEVVNIKR